MWEKGTIGESITARWLRSRGYTVIPAYEKQVSDWKGPRVYLPEGQLVAPDLFALITRHDQTYAFWGEVKTKERFTWRFTEGVWQTGLDCKYFEEYKELWEVHKLPVYIFFYHRRTDTDVRDVQRGAPDTCPAGLFVQRLDTLLALAQRGGRRGHTDQHTGKYTPMVYWYIHHLQQYATLEQISQITELCAPSQ